MPNLHKLVIVVFCTVFVDNSCCFFDLMNVIPNIEILMKICN